MTDRDVDDAFARSFLADLPAEVTARLRAEGERADYPAGTRLVLGVMIDPHQPDQLAPFALVERPTDGGWRTVAR